VNSKETFSFSKVQRGLGSGDETSTPAFVLLSFKDGQGTIRENITLSLSPLNQGYTSEGLDLQPGNYELLEFSILDGAHKTLYATPKEGSALAPNIANPLPLGFVVSQNGAGQFVPPVLEVTPDDTPGAFGYTSFGLNTTDNTDVMLINQMLKLRSAVCSMKMWMRISGSAAMMPIIYCNGKRLQLRRPCRQPVGS